MNKSFLKFILPAAIFMVAGCLHGQSNPFSIIMKNSIQDAGGELNHVLHVTVRSISREKSKYFFKLNIPAANFQILEGKTNYRGVINGLGENTFDILINPVKLGTGEIRATVYTFAVDDATIDANNKRIFYAKYEVSADPGDSTKYVFAMKDVMEREVRNVNTEEEERETDTAELAVNTGETAQGIAGTAEQAAPQEESHKFVYEKGKRNSPFKYLFLMISFGIVGIMYYWYKKL